MAAASPLKLQIEAHDLSELARLATAEVPVGGALVGSVQVDLKQRVLHVATNLHGTQLRGPGFAVAPEAAGAADAQGPGARLRVHPNVS